jgi:ABC-type multidrug transport system permease subunit
MRLSFPTILGVTSVALVLSVGCNRPSKPFPVRSETMPWIFYALGAVLPTTYFIDLVRAIILRGATFLEYWPSLGIMSAMAVLLFCVCALRFRKKLR